MPRHAVTAMLQGLLGVLLASSLCSAMLMPNVSYTRLHGEDASSAEDPNSHFWPTDGGATESSEESFPWPPSSTRGAHPPMEGLLPPNGSGRMGEGLPPMDLSICSVLLSMDPPMPPDQIPYFCLCSHCKGTPGPKGDRGDQGLPGPPGSPGMRGMTGMRGRPGFTGPQGTKGQKGDLGQKGEMGSAGFAGMKGERGLKGEKGERGIVGPQGTQGPQGETGTCPASCESAEGPPGTQGPAGPPGARGLPGVKGAMGPKGYAGDKGDMGMPGEPGTDGMKGDQGEQGVCECSNGANGRDGPPGLKGDKGDGGEGGAQGATGAAGAKGDPGMMGPMGPPGPCSPAIQSAFTACANESFPRPNWPVQFPNVVSNHQGHFNPLMGMYTAPVNGTYIFSYHLAVASLTLKVGIFVNFFPKAKSTEAGEGSTTSQTLVQHLRTGDRVWLQVKSGDTNGMVADGESSSCFTGYLLHPDSCDLPIGRHFPPHFPPPPLKGTYSWGGLPPP